MEITEHIEGLATEGRLLAAAAAAAGLDAPIPTCPEWRMRDLVVHIGKVHRWAAAHVREQSVEPVQVAAAVTDAPPADDELIGWFQAGHEALVAVLLAADPDVRCWTFLPARSPLAFWARRQAMETAIHRADAESPAGVFTAFPPEFAADGIDEILSCFVPRPSSQLRSDPARTLAYETTDTDDRWLVHVGPDKVETVRADGPADCTVRGSAPDLFLLAWNRRAPEGLDVKGDAALLDLWRGQVQIRWR